MSFAISASVWAAVCIAGYLLVPRIYAWATTPAPLVPPVQPAAETVDVLDLQAANRLRARAVRLNCPEMKAGIAQVFEHFFHGSETT